MDAETNNMEPIQLDSTPTNPSSDDAATSSVATATETTTTEEGTATNTSSGTMAWIGQQLREELGLSSATMNESVQQSKGELNSLQQQQDNMAKTVTLMRTRYAALFESLGAMGQLVYEIGIAEQEALGSVMIDSGTSMKDVSKSFVTDAGLDKTFDEVLASLKTSSKVIADAKETQESLRISRLLYDAAHRKVEASPGTPSLEAEFKVQKQKYDDLVNVFLLKVSLVRQHVQQSLLKQVTHLREALASAFVQASTKLSPEPSELSKRASMREGPLTKELQKMLDKE